MTDSMMFDLMAFGLVAKWCWEVKNWRPFIQGLKRNSPKQNSMQKIAMFLMLMLLLTL